MPLSSTFPISSLRSQHINHCLLWPLQSFLLTLLFTARYSHLPALTVVGSVLTFPRSTVPYSLFPNSRVYVAVHSKLFCLLFASRFVSDTMEKENKSICWRPKNALIECIVMTKCFEEKQDIEECVSANDCFLERRNWTLCKMNAMNPRYRLRGNPYDVSTESQKKVEARDERIRKREMEEDGVFTK